MNYRRIMELAIEELTKRRKQIEDEIKMIGTEIIGAVRQRPKTAAVKERKRRTRTAAQRRAQSQRMREYWASKRAARAAKPAVRLRVLPAASHLKARTRSEAQRRAQSLKMKQVWKRRKATAAGRARVARAAK